MNVLHLIQQLLHYLIQKCILYLNRTTLVVLIVVWNSKNSYFWSASWTPLNPLSSQRHNLCRISGHMKTKSPKYFLSYLIVPLHDNIGFIIIAWHLCRQGWLVFHASLSVFRIEYSLNLYLFVEPFTIVDDSSVINVNF